MLGRSRAGRRRSSSECPSGKHKTGPSRQDMSRQSGGGQRRDWTFSHLGLNLSCRAPSWSLLHLKGVELLPSCMLSRKLCRLFKGTSSIEARQSHPLRMGSQREFSGQALEAPKLGRMTSYSDKKVTSQTQLSHRKLPQRSEHGLSRSGFLGRQASDSLSSQTVLGLGALLVSGMADTVVYWPFSVRATGGPTR